jgi:hypothetical protein
MLHFPKDVAVENDGGLSCESFCSYHGTYKRNGQRAYYAVIPDFGSDTCAAACSYETNAQQRTFEAVSRELANTITNPARELDQWEPGPPTGWSDRGVLDNNLCGLFPSGRQNGRAVALMWSNEDHACRSRVSAGLGSKVELVASPGDVRVIAGSSRSFQVKAKGAPSAVLDLHAEIQFLQNISPSKLHISIEPPSISGGMSATVTLTAERGNLDDWTYEEVGTGIFLYGVDANREVHPVVVGVGVHRPEVGPPPPPPPAPVITSLNVTRGPSMGLTTVVVTGMNFKIGPGDGDQSAFWFSSGGGQREDIIEPTQVAADGRSMSFVTPASSPGWVDFNAANGVGLQATLPKAFEYVAGPVATMEPINPAFGPLIGGNVVTIKGTNFDNAGLNVSVGSVEWGAGFSPRWAPENREYELIMPEGTAAGIVPLVVTLASGQKLSTTYRYDRSPILARLTQVTGPATGGTYVTVFGMQVDAGAEVLFGSKPGRVTSRSTFGKTVALGVLTPAHAPGAVSVVVKNPDGTTGTQEQAFTYQAR